MLIEKDARRHIQKAIETEQELTLIEVKEKFKGKIIVQNEDYIKLKIKLAKIISQINSVANTEGKGRDDLTYEIL